MRIYKKTIQIKNLKHQNNQIIITFLIYFNIWIKKIKIMLPYYPINQKIQIKLIKPNNQDKVNLDYFVKKKIQNIL